MPIHGYPGNVVTANPTSPTNTTASGVWTLEQQLQAQAAGNWPMAATQISRSLRFNSADSAYLVRQNSGTAGDRKVWTLSFWMKPSVISTVGTAGDGPHLFMVGNNNPNGGGGPSVYSRFLLTGSSNNLVWQSNSSAGEAFTSTNVFRDLSAWYHVVVSFDASNTIIRCYVNNQEITYASRTNPSNTNSAVNAASYYNSFGIFHTADVRGWNGYLTQFQFIDGQALTPNSFGFFDNDGIWTPKQYTGPYGTNGFYLNFSDNSGTTSTTLGKDYSGNGNNWTPNNFSVTAGVGNDSLVDSPTRFGTDTGLGGECVGNYATYNPLWKGSGAVFTNGNLDNVPTTAVSGALITMPVSSGKWYAEISHSVTNISAVGMFFTAANLSAPSFTVGSTVQTGLWMWYDNGTGVYATSDGAAFGGAFMSSTFRTAGTFQFALDADNGKFWFGKNNTWYDSSGGTTGNPTTGANPTFTISASRGPFNFGVGQNGGNVTMSLNSGQRPFAYTAPSGFKALCTTNLPEPTVADGGEYFNTVLWTGDGSYPRTITGVGFQPDLVWIKGRTTTYSHIVYDAVRGTGTSKNLSTNETGAEGGNSLYANLTAFASDGFTVGTTSATNVLNNSGTPFVAWNWKANGSGVSNTDGTITSTVSANTTSGFSIVKWTGNSSNSDGVGHGLGVAPKIVIYKVRNGTSSWYVWTTAINGSNYELYLNQTGTGGAVGAVYGNITSTTISNYGWTTGNDMVAYCFAEVPGFSKISTYVGNGSADGTFVYTGFRPRYVLIKNASTTGDWFLYDTARNTYNVADNRLKANLSDAEGTGGSYGPDILSNGFKMRSNFGELNGSGNTIIYACFAENPFKYSNAR